MVVVMFGGVTFEVRWVGALGERPLATWLCPDDLDLVTGIPTVCFVPDRTKHTA